MATCTTTSNCRHDGDPRRSSRWPVDAEDEVGVGLSADAIDDLDEDPGMIDSWGSRDSLTCLANWG
jgi:hypothetical protein